MLPDDANPAGNVHGGTILKMVEQVGYLAATVSGHVALTASLWGMHSALV